MASILYLDDEDAIVLLMTRMLEVLGHRAVGYTRAADALAAFQKDSGRFDLVITDLAMPGTSGFEFARQIREIHPGAAVAAVSGYVDPRDAQVASAQGILAIVVKPHTIEEMSRTVGGLLEKAGVTAAAGQ
jgi:DNA-binding NtrC family response regulator